MKINAALRLAASQKVEATQSYPGLLGYIKKVNEDFKIKDDPEEQLQFALKQKVVPLPRIQALDKWLNANKDKWLDLEEAGNEERFKGITAQMQKDWYKFFDEIF